MAAGFNADGTFEARSHAEIEAAIVARQRATIDPELDTEPEGLIGQLNGIVSDHLAQLWDLALALHDAIDPDAAVGAQQDALYALTGTLRRDQSRSTVLAQVTIAGNTTIAAGAAQASVAGNSGAKFRNTTAIVNAGSSPITVDAPFAALDFGPVAAPGGTLTVIDTPVSGWQAVTNAADADLGRLLEPDNAFRRRQWTELAGQGGGSVPALRADLLALATVRAATVTENTTDLTVAGLPPKSFEAVVQSRAGVPSDDAAIAQVIWDSKPAGIATHGTTAVVVTDSEGVQHTVRYSRTAERAIYLALRVLTDPARYAGDDALKLAIVNAAEAPEAVGYLDVGADVYGGRFVAAAMAVPGVVNAEARMSFAPIVDFNAAASSLVIAPREIAAVDTTRISIGPFP